MANEMFCFQCEQTAGCAGCTGRAGVCGKTAAVANAQDDLTPVSYTHLVTNLLFLYFYSKKQTVSTRNSKYF